MSNSPKIEVERESDGRWLAEIPSIPGVMAYGESKEEAIAKVERLKVMTERPDPREWAKRLAVAADDEIVYENSSGYWHPAEGLFYEFAAATYRHAAAVCETSKTTIHGTDEFRYGYMAASGFIEMELNRLASETKGEQG